MNDEEILLKESLQNLSSVLGQDEIISIPEGNSSLFQACEIIGNASGITFVSPSQAPFTLESICSESKVRFRRIILKPAFWKNNQGHFLAFLKDDQQPVVLYYKKNNYLIINPVTKEIIPFNSELILPFAYMFYASLPKKISGITDIAKFCLKGTSSDYLSLMIAGALAIFISFIFPLANKVFFDYVIPNLDISLYTQMLIAITLGAISSTIFMLCRSFFVLRLNGTFENRLQMGFWDRLLQLPIQFFRKMGLGDLMNRTLILNQFHRNLSTNTLLLLFNSFFSVLYLIMMFVYSWQLSLIALVVSLIALIISISLSYARLTYERKLLASNADINTFLTQVVNGISKIRVAGVENRIFSNWAKAYRENQNLTLKIKGYQVKIISLNKFFNYFSTFLIYAFIILLIYYKSNESVFNIVPIIPIGTFLAFSASLSPFLQAVMDIGNNLSSLLSFIPFWERARPLLQTPVESNDNKAAKVSLTGNCQIENLYFRYHENMPLAIENISMHIDPKTFVAIVGPSGSGKSTLLQLLIGIETPEKGVISYDNYDMKILNLHHLRQQMGIVSQNSSIFFGSIFDNIVCGAKYPPEQILEAMELSQFKQELTELPMGIHTILPGGGGTLSGGQRQKLLLARALVRKPKILLLDEATSSLDNQTQSTISENIKNLGITRIVIAHRFSSIIKADQIYVMDKGKIIAHGTSDELLVKNTWFKHNYERQNIE